MEKKWIGDYVDLDIINKGMFNLIASGTGTGKTKFILTGFRQRIANVKSSEILYLVSRSLVVEQQTKEDEKDVTKYNPRDKKYVKYWNGEIDSIEEIEKAGIQVMTYDKLIYIIKDMNNPKFKTLNNLKVIIFDECHTLFTDLFIKDIEILKVWIRDTLYTNEKYIIGMTATPSILYYNRLKWGVMIQKLNKEVLINHKAKQLYCTDFKTIPYLIATQLRGKTLIMCYSISDCKKLKEDLPNSFILTSKANKSNTIQMNIVRKNIKNLGKLPDTFIDNDGIEKELDVLITTSTLREGINLEKESGVRNIICCFSDELTITQFAGRCRYDIDALIVADTHINSFSFDSNKYLVKCKDSFKDFLKNSENTSWFDSIAHIVKHDVVNTIKFALSTNEARFIDFINRKWLVPKGITDKDMIKYKIYKKEDKDEIVKMVVKCKILKLYYSQITFNKVVDLMQNTLGYTITTGRSMFDKEQHTYKLIIDFMDKNLSKDRENEVI